MDENSKVDMYALRTQGALTTRVNDVFAGLGQLEAQHIAHERNRPTEDDTLVKPDPKVHNLDLGPSRPSSTPYYGRGTKRSADDNKGSQESGSTTFKKPKDPPFRRPGRGRHVPDHQRHPERYTHYNLGDVTPDQMSENANTRAALDFLATVKTQDDDDEEMLEDDQSSGKIIFKKPSTQQEPKATNTTERSGCLMMPEYVVGQKPNKTKQSVKKSTATTSAVSIGHIMDDDDDDDDDDEVPVQPTRTIFSGMATEKTSDSDVTEQNFVSFLGKSRQKKTRVMRNRDEDEEDEEDCNLDGVD